MVFKGISVERDDELLNPAFDPSLVDARGCNKPAGKLLFRGVRSSKFRHVFGQPAKREKCFDNVNITKNAHDSQFCAVNPKFIAIVTEVAGGGAFIVLPIERTGRVDYHANRVTGHSGPVLDIKWNPFNDNVIASCSDDCTIKIWWIPDGGLISPLNDWLADLHGHKRRVAYVEWHPTAENILASAGFDYLIYLWDTGKGEAIKVIDCHKDVIYCLSFNRDGSRLATTSKDKKLRIIDPRTGVVISEGSCHSGRCSKVAYLRNELVATVGFSRHNDRQLAIWNENSLTSPLNIETVDSSSGVLFPFFDYDSNILFLAGKGDGNIRYYEIVDTNPHVHFLNQYLSGLPQRSLGYMPKRGCDVTQCEIFRFYKLHTTRATCEPISMIVPRKSDQFQDDLYPETAAPMPAVTADEWISGINRPPVLMSLKSGVTIKTHKKMPLPATNRIPSDTFQVKLAFLNETTLPDYRPLDQRETPVIPELQTRDTPVIPDVVQNTIPNIIETQKRNTKLSTKFKEIKQKFGKSIDSDEKTDKYVNNHDLEEITKGCKKCHDLDQYRKQLALKDKTIDDLNKKIKELEKKLKSANK